MTRRYHSNSRIFFDNPYVVRTSYEHTQLQSSVEAAHRTLTRKTYKLCQGTWGHSTIVGETVYKNARAPDKIDALFDDCYFEYRAYFCFKHELDALQFRLTLDTSAVHVHMWPSDTRFIIHEVVE